jgi:hypothetical protein
VNTLSGENVVLLIVNLVACLVNTERLISRKEQVEQHWFSQVRGSDTGFCDSKGEWRRLHNKELYALYSSPSIIRVMKSRRLRWAGHVARMGERGGVYRALVGKPEGRRPLRRPRRRWEDNIKMDLLEVGWGGMDWINVAQDRDRWRALVNLRVA